MDGRNSFLRITLKVLVNDNLDTTSATHTTNFYHMLEHLLHDLQNIFVYSTGTVFYTSDFW